MADLLLSENPFPQVLGVNPECQKPFRQLKGIPTICQPFTPRRIEGGIEAG
jgi:hypothetical protein